MSYKPIYYDDSSVDYRQQATEFVDSIPDRVKDYLWRLFPIVQWLPRYNRNWLIGDLIAGITIGCVVVPQGMGYAKLADLEVQIGLYSSFVGVFIYCFFATSKDITIGPVAVMSLLMAEILKDLDVNTKKNPQEAILVASALALLSGLIALGMGLFRLGFIIDFISGPAIAGFMSGSALTIGISQLPGLLGIPSTLVNNRAESYKVLGNTFRYIKHSHKDAAFGFVVLFVLYLIRFGTEYLGKRFPKYKKPLFFFRTARSVLVVIITTGIAYAVSKDHRADPPIKLLGTVPSGLHHLGAPHLTHDLVSKLGDKLPVVVLILILEHMAIAKSFGRLNDYVINPNQELIAIGVSNIIGSLFKAYPVTGSFSRTAIKARAGVRSPLAGIFSGLVVLLAIYVLTPSFYYIPNATLCAVIIHAVADLFSGPKTWKAYWKVNPFELLVFVLGVVITFFTTVEIGIYVSVAFSLFLLLIRIARPRFSVLGRVPIYNQSLKDSVGKLEDSEKAAGSGSEAPGEPEKYFYLPVGHKSVKSKSAILPMPPGVVVIRLEEAYTYPNASFITDKIIDAAKAVTRRGGQPPTEETRAWNDPFDEDLDQVKNNLPLLKAVVIDFVSVPSFDTTGLQGLSAARAALDRYAAQPVEWHFANVSNASVRRSLLSGGFSGVARSANETERFGIVPGLNSQTSTENPSENAIEMVRVEVGISQAGLTPPSTEFIHFDLDDAVRVASRE